MAPTLIDTRGWIKFGFIALFLAAIIFSSGFLLGFKDASTYYPVNKEPFTLSLPEKTVVYDDSIKQVTPDVISVGEVIDVDQSGTTAILSTANVSVTENDNAGNTALLKELEKEKNNIIAELNTPRLAMYKNHVLESPNGLDLTPENADKINFSIQVGMYGRLSNAEKMVTRLNAEKFDAYVSEFINRQNEIRYNVRIGYFVDKKSARETLKYFRSRHSSEAYLVNFSIDTMVLMAEAEEKTEEEETKTKLIPDSLPISDEVLRVNQGDNPENNQQNKLQEVAFTVSETRHN